MSTDIDLNTLDETKPETAALQPAKKPRAKKAAKPVQAKTAEALKVATEAFAQVSAEVHTPVGVPQEEKRVRIILEENDEIPPTGLYVGVNGKGYLIKAGEEVSVPESVIEVLKNAIKDKPIMESGRIVRYRKASRFPFQRLD